MLILTGHWVITVIVVTFLYWLLPEKWRNWWLVLTSATFLGFLSPASLVILTGFTVLTYVITAGKDRISGKSLVLFIAVTGMVLSFYKFKDLLNPGPLIDLDPLTEDYIIPLGLSYYAFRCIHYAVEKYKGTIRPHPFSEFIQYIFFLPTFLAGPIHRFPAFQRDLRRKRWDIFLLTQGLERILFGYVKIAFIANLLVTNYFGIFIMKNTEYGSLQSYLMMIKHSMNLYFQFSGYSAIAIGFGMMLGFKVIENFNFPFLARNISDFWARWHISLTSWCKDYVYMGTIAITRNAALAALAAMIVMGLWHDFSLRFLLWGFYHGIGIMIWQQFQTFKIYLPKFDNRILSGMLRVGSTLLTLHYFMFGVLLAQHASLTDALKEWQNILVFWL